MGNTVGLTSTLAAPTRNKSDWAGLERAQKRKKGKERKMEVVTRRMMRMTRKMRMTREIVAKQKFAMCLSRRETPVVGPHRVRSGSFLGTRSLVVGTM